jgi:GAF domain-containing protein/HAMP domain-containing protein
MILVLGLLTIVPLSILTGISRTNLERTLIEEANQSLVLSASQMASSVDAYIQLNLDGVRTETQLPDIVAYLSQTTGIRRNQLLLERGTPLEASALEVLYAIARKDPINIQSVRLMDRSGLIQLSTDPDEINLQFLAADYLSRPYNTGLPYLSPPRVTADGEQIHFSAPVRSTAGDRAGVLDIVYSAKVFQQLMVRNSARLGPDVSALLLDEARVIVAHSESPESLFKVANPESPTEVMQLVMDGRLPDLAPEEIQVELSGLSEGLANAAANPVFAGELDPEPGGETTVEQAAIASLQSAEWKLVTFIPQSILLAPVQVQTRNLVVISILISLAAIAAALGLTQLLVAPILGLARTSERIAHGDVEATADVRTKDEIGYLADGFNIMTARLRDLITGLEERVAERTQALERRAVQLQAAADVGSTAARLRDLDELLRQVTRLISQRFGFYHVGIFLLDERSEYAVLRAANSEGGQRMLGRGHKLKVGQVGIVGFVAATGQPRMASDVDEDTEFFNNPDLPLTHSEMALPMIAGKKTLGVLDVQSTQQAAFSEEDITTLKVLADQLVIAIENARLFTENQNALDAARRAYGQMGREGWQRLLREARTDLGFISLGEEEVRPASGDVSPELIQTLRAGEPVLGSSAATLYLPVQVRGQGIGAIRLDKKAARGSWSDEDVALARALAEQLGTALESARLYNDISQRAEREFAISEIVSKIGSSIQLDTILRTTVQELGQVLGDTEVILQLGTSGKGKKGNHRE